MATGDPLFGEQWPETPQRAPKAFPRRLAPVQRPARPDNPEGDMPAVTRELLRAGKLWQTCECGAWSAATWYCYKCFRPMTSGDWYQNVARSRHPHRPEIAA
jgi:hypothetical protein